MPQPVADQLQSIPMSPNLSQSFARARELAREQSHRALLLEHVLLALTGDPEASGVLRACNVDIDRLNTDISGYLGRLTEDMRAAPGTEPAPDPELLRVLEAARQAAQQSRRTAIDGAIVLAAIVGDGKSPAAGLLETHGMTFEEAIRSLQKASAQARSKQYATSASAARAQAERPAAARKAEAEAPAPAPARAAAPTPASEPSSGGQSSDEILAAARARIQQRNAGAAGTKPEAKVEAKPQDRPEAQPAAKPAARLGAKLGAEAPPAEPELPLMSLSSFKAAGAPEPPELPPLPVGKPASEGARLPPLPQGAGPAGPSPAPLLPGGGGGQMQAQIEPHLPPPRRPAQRPGEAAPRPPPPRWPDRGQRPDAPEPPALTGRPGTANGAAPGPRRAPGEAAARPPPRPAAGQRQGQRSAAGPLMEAIPRHMRVGSAAAAQVRIPRDKVESLMQLLLAGRGQQPDAAYAYVLSVRLRAPEGGFAIEPATPETQWVEAPPGHPPGHHPEEPVSWRWTVTPLRRGRRRLQLLVGVRSVGDDGVGPEAAPPDRTIEVSVGANRLRRLGRAVLYLMLLGVGAALGVLSQDKLAQDLADFAGSAAKNLLGLLRTSGFLG
jgi:hypothetical protein